MKVLPWLFSSWLLAGASSIDAQVHLHSTDTPNHVDRTVEISAFDTMRFSVDDLFVQPGETIRFIVTNEGRLQHEFSIGTVEDQRAHAESMRRNPEQVHAEANALVLRPKETKTLIWRFSGEAEVEISCMVPGHYEAGMIIPLKWTWGRGSDGRRLTGPPE